MTVADLVHPTGTPGTAHVDLSIVILEGGFLSDELIRECLQCVDKARARFGRRAEIIVVDNGTKRNIATWIKSEFPDFSVMRFSAVVSFSAANNAAFRVSRGRYIAQLNDDLKPEAGLFRELVEFMDSHPDTGAAGPRLLNPDGTLQIGYYIRAFPTLLGTFCDLFWVNRLWPNNPVLRQQYMAEADPELLQSVDQVAGACLLYRRSALFEIGLLDEVFTFAFDDVDVCLRLQQSGLKVFYVPSARAMHYGGCSLKEFAKVSEAWLNGMLYFYWKHSSKRQFLKVRLMLLFAIFVRLPVMALASLDPRSHSAKTRWRGAISTYVRFFFTCLGSFVRTWTPRAPQPSPEPLILPSQYEPAYQHRARD